MNWFLLLIVAFVLFMTVRQLIAARPGIPLDDAKAALKTGTAILVDVREPLEWTGGVAKTASLMPFSDLRGERTQWRAFLEKNRARKILVYCASGTRSGMVASRLRKEGFDAVNAGSLRDWDRAGWPICSPKSR
ncbi:MAG: rhodanese-like domain-containing protein [Opitutae bacterium]|nr:rhodanese-like domain-containing protein [Opitutae bacterium]